MMRRSQKLSAAYEGDEDATYFTYRPLSNLPTPPPSSRESCASSTFCDEADAEPLKSTYLGPAIHLINLIPSSASLASTSIPRVQSMLSRTDLPLETIALAVCILDSLDAKFARKWRLSCPLRCNLLRTTSKRHTLPPSLPAPQSQLAPQLHIDSVNPELIVLAALVIAVKFIEDPQESTQYYCQEWGRDVWSYDQLNVTERCIMESLDYRIMPLCDEDCLTDAMVDMQLAAQQPGFHTREITPPDSVSGDETPTFVPSHCRSKTMVTGHAVMGRGDTLTPVDTPGIKPSRSTTPRPALDGPDYFDQALS
ncbi:hypothetical protein B0I35DRAFT_506615 [Stachybotrys elegans]|uniref:Cyclin N-terminal domain-containing protein n=1 Tax=Stachybotrys elegans TaxID=80388 RepID=A0A8K0T2B6_9HYPO|nr:hypothetical protein B0I35DRAFT_506615 [Stachybotrys elegans]